MSRKQRQSEVRAFITELSESRPQYVKEAKQRAKEQTDAGWVTACPICDDGTMLDTLHIFPPLVQDFDDPKLGSEIHIRCPKCQHEDLFTIAFDEDDENAYDKALEIEKTGRYPQEQIEELKGDITGRKRRKRRKRR